MPNWCSNTLTITGEKKDMKKFFSKAGYNSGSLKLFVETERLSLRSWLPMPETYFKWDTTNDKRPKDSDETEEQYKAYCKEYDEAVQYQLDTYGIVGWYNYNKATLGCKWDCDFSKGIYSERGDMVCVEYYFDSPWCPPEEWFYTMTINNPDITFEMHSSEPGMEIELSITGSRGSIVHRTELQ